MAEAARTIATGEDAPNFDLPDGRGLPWSLSGQLESSPVVLVFYRGDWCPFANGQLATLARSHEQFERRGASVVGVSTDPPTANLVMRNKLLIPFTVLSDVRGDVAASYGLWDDGEGASVPAVVIVDRSGVVRYVYAGVDVADHPPLDDLLDAVRRLPRVEKRGMRGPEVVLSAADARERRVRHHDREPVPLETLPAFYEGALLASRTLVSRLRESGWTGRRAAGRAERYVRMLSAYRDAARETMALVEG